MWELIVPVLRNVIIFFLFMFLLIIVQVSVVNDIPDKSELLEENDIKTGDLLGVSYKSGFGSFITFWTESIWSHGGIAWRDSSSNELFILESAHYYAPWIGILKIPFRTWIKFNKKSMIALTRLESDIHLDADRLISNFNIFKDVELDRLNWTWTRLLNKGPYTGEIQKHYTCYELVISVLQLTGIVQKKYASFSYFPRSIVRGELEMEPGFRYRPPVLLDVGNFAKVMKEG